MATGKTTKAKARRKRTAATGTVTPSYFALVREHPLRTIRDEDQLDRASALVNRLLDLPSRDAGEELYLDVLATLIEQFESEAYPEEPVSDADMLAHLIEARGVTQAEASKGTGIDVTTISLILSGKRQLTREHIGKVAQFFRVDAGVFFPRS